MDWLPRLNCASDNLGDIFDLHFIFGLHAFEPIIKHGDAEGTGGSQHFCTCIQGLAHTCLVDTFADLFLHPGTTTTVATTETLVLVAAHLGYTIAVEHSQYTSR